jgi:cytochrome b pre-mRNA-processing protein 6
MLLSYSKLSITMKTLQKHYLRLIRRWPTDSLRSITAPDAFRRHLESRFVGQNNAVPDEKTELSQINALYSLLENRYSKKYETSDEMLKPAFNPSYYADLQAEMEAAPKRTWLQRKWLRWSRIVRMT